MEGSDRIKLNVGGKLFETTASTIQAAGQDSLLTTLSSSSSDGEPVFIDRDPDIFAALLSLLRTGRLPSSARRFSKQDLVEEAHFYGIEDRLRTATSPPPLVGFDAALADTIYPASDGFPTVLSSEIEDGSLWIAHGGQISAYDWSLAHVGTVRTHVDNTTSLRRVSAEIAAVGSPNSPGLHLYGVPSGRHVGSIHWSDPSDPRVYKARVTAIASCGPHPLVYAAFECPHRENCVAAVDGATLQIVSEMGRQSGSAIKTAAPGRLAHVPALGLMLATAVSAGAFGYSGYMRLCDPRSGTMVWETCEPGGAGRSSRFGDSFADADADPEELALYKVCWKSGDVAAADMRMLGEDPWVYLGGGGGGGGGEGSVLRCHKRQVFVSKEGGLEAWSPVEEGGEGLGEGRFGRLRRYLVDKEEDARRGMVRMMEGGGERLFVCRDGAEGVEVWESSTCSAAVLFSLPHTQR